LPHLGLDLGTDLFATSLPLLLSQRTREAITYFFTTTEVKSFWLLVHSSALHLRVSSQLKASLFPALGRLQFGLKGSLAPIGQVSLSHFHCITLGDVWQDAVDFRP